MSQVCHPWTLLRGRPHQALQSGVPPGLLGSLAKAADQVSGSLLQGLHDFPEKSTHLMLQQLPLHPCQHDPLQNSYWCAGVKWEHCHFWLDPLEASKQLCISAEQSTAGTVIYCVISCWDARTGLSIIVEHCMHGIFLWPVPQHSDAHTLFMADSGPSFSRRPHAVSNLTSSPMSALPLEVQAHTLFLQAGVSAAGSCLLDSARTARLGGCLELGHARMVLLRAGADDAVHRAISGQSMQSVSAACRGCRCNAL